MPIKCMPYMYNLPTPISNSYNVMLTRSGRLNTGFMFDSWDNLASAFF